MKYLKSIMQFWEDNETPPVKMCNAIWDGGVASGVRYPGNWVHSGSWNAPLFLIVRANDLRKEYLYVMIHNFLFPHVSKKKNPYTDQLTQI